ncbi:hypothetical protein NLI96_g1175 [Meripilus lineatus]|uniref:Uncharacterized protein n=1 Tax=Meripilus lineatus TaxID=2056292 RepID=A0AAD5YIM8_9APHY|nr:hypothetical protein NLI96_g1175 [Physisporinus lineatus]
MVELLKDQGVEGHRYDRRERDMDGRRWAPGLRSRSGKASRPRLRRGVARTDVDKGRPLCFFNSRCGPSDVAAGYKEEDDEDQGERTKSGGALSFPRVPREGKDDGGVPNCPCPGADLYVVLGISTSFGFNLSRVRETNMRLKSKRNS